MGSWLSFERTTEDIIEDIDNSNRFYSYQVKFEDLVPTRQLYIEENNIVIEVGTNTSYSVSRLQFNWEDPEIETVLYEYLDNMYNTYVYSQNISGHEEVDRPTDIDTSTTESVEGIYDE